MRHLLFLFLSVFTLVIFAQEEKRILRATKVYDTAHTIVYYDLEYRTDSTKIHKYRRGKTVLQISEKYLAFTDYYIQIVDSLNDYAVGSKKREKLVSEPLSKAGGLVRYRIPLLTDLSRGQTTFQLGMWTQLEYTIPTPQIDWNLMAGDTLVNGVTCKKAMGRYAGRTYVAWYAESVQLPYGPYIFGGLPGLIMCIYDTKRNWVFTNSGIKPATSLAKMYLYTEKEREKMDRKKALSIYRNELENMFSVGIAKGRLLNVPPELVQKTSSNMLELEW